MNVSNKKRYLALWVAGLAVPAAFVTVVAVACNNESSDPNKNELTRENAGGSNKNNQVPIDPKKLNDIRVSNFETILSNAKTYEDREALKDSKDLIFQFTNKKEPLVRKEGYYEMTFNLANGENKKVAVVLAPRTGVSNASNTINSTATTVLAEEATVQFRNLSAAQEYKVVGLIILNDDNETIDKNLSVQIPSKNNRISKKAADDAWEEKNEHDDEPVTSEKVTINSNTKLGNKYLKSTEVDIPHIQDAFREVADNTFVLTYSLTYRNNLYTKAYIIEEGEKDLSKALESDVVLIGKTIANVKIKNVDPNKKYRIQKIEIYDKKGEDATLIQTIEGDVLSKLGTFQKNKNIGFNSNISSVLINEPERTLYNYSDDRGRLLELRFRLQNPKKFINKKVKAILTTTPREDIRTDYKNLSDIVYNNDGDRTDYVDEYGIAHVTFSNYVHFKKEYYIHSLEVVGTGADDEDDSNDAQPKQLAFDGYKQQLVKTPPHKIELIDGQTTIIDPNDDIFDKERNSNEKVKLEDLGPLAYDSNVWNYSRKLASVPASLDYDKELGFGTPRYYYANVKIIRNQDNINLQQINNLDEDTYLEFVIKELSSGKIIHSRKVLINKNGAAKVTFAYEDAPDNDKPKDFVKLEEEYEITGINYYRLVEKENDDESEEQYQKLDINIPIPNTHLNTWISRQN